jgi:hypothetical protein
MVTVICWGPATTANGTVHVRPPGAGAQFGEVGVKAANEYATCEPFTSDEKSIAMVEGEIHWAWRAPDVVPVLRGITIVAVALLFVAPAGLCTAGTDPLEPEPPPQPASAPVQTAVRTTVQNRFDKACMIIGSSGGPIGRLRLRW